MKKIFDKLKFYIKKNNIFFYVLVAVCLFIMLILPACRTTEDIKEHTTITNTNNSTKLDSQSKITLSLAEEDTPNELLNILIMFEDEPSLEYINKLKEENVKIISKTGKIISAQALAVDIKKILFYDSIKKIEIDKRKQIIK